MHMCCTFVVSSWCECGLETVTLPRVRACQPTILQGMQVEHCCLVLVTADEDQTEARPCAYECKRKTSRFTNWDVVDWIPSAGSHLQEKARRKRDRAFVDSGVTLTFATIKHWVIKATPWVITATPTAVVRLDGFLSM